MSVEVVTDLEFLQIFKSLQNNLRNKLHLLCQNEDGCIIIRANIKKSVEATLFIEQYESLTNSRYKIYSQRKSSSGLLFKKEWVCQHHFSSGVEKCPSKISISVNRCSNMKKANDEFLRLSPPLQAVIEILPYHNHDVTEVPPPGLCKIPKEVCEMYYGYFNQGIKGIKAKRLHEKNLQKVKVQAADGTRLNPSMTAVYTLYKKWRKLTKNSEINKVRTCDSAAVPVTRSRAKLDSALISQVIKIEPTDEEDEDNCPSSRISDFHENEVNVKIEDTDEEDDYNCPKKIRLNSSNPHENQLNVKVEDTDEEDDYNCHIQNTASNCNGSKIRNKHKSPKIVNCCSLNTRSRNNVMPSTPVVTNNGTRQFSKIRNKHKSPNIVNRCSLNTRPQNVMPSTPVVTNNTPYYISPTLIQPNNFVSIHNPPVPLIATNVNTFVVSSVQRAVSINNSYLTLYNPSSNTYTVVQLCLPTSPIVSASNFYSAHFPNGIQSPTRVGIHKL